MHKPSEKVLSHPQEIDCEYECGESNSNLTDQSTGEANEARLMGGYD